MRKNRDLEPQTLVGVRNSLRVALEIYEEGRKGSAVIRMNAKTGRNSSLIIIKKVEVWRKDLHVGFQRHKEGSKSLHVSALRVALRVLCGNVGRAFYNLKIRYPD